MTRVLTQDKVSDIIDAATGYMNMNKFPVHPGVDKIGCRAFFKLGELTDIILPESLTVISWKAFAGCTGLTEIILPESLRMIDSYAFGYCTGLTEIIIPGNMTQISEGAFYGCTGLTEITLPEKMTTIKKYAFAKCTGLTKIILPKSLTEIEKYAFFRCTGLTEITIPEKITEIGKGAFDKCDMLYEVKCCSTQLGIVDFGVLYIKCKGIVSTLTGDKYDVVITVPHDVSLFNPKKDVLASLKLLDVVTNEDQFEIIYNDVRLEEDIDAILDGKVDFNHLILVYN